MKVEVGTPTSMTVGGLLAQKAKRKAQTENHQTLLVKNQSLK